MKQTIAELGIGGEGWIIYDDDDDFILPKRIAHITVVNKWTDNEFLLREDLESDAIKTTRDLIVPDDQIVYNTWGEAEKVRSEEISNTIMSTEQKSVDWKKLADELGSIQKQFNEVAEDQKKDLCAFIKEIKNISNPQPYNTDWNQVRINAAICTLNALLNTTKHSVLGDFAVDMFPKTAVRYADKLVYELKRSEAYFEEKLKNS